MSMNMTLLLAEISDVTWQALIAGVVTVILAYMSHRTKQKVEDEAGQSKVRVREVKVKVEEVKDSVDEIKESVAHTEGETAARLKAIARIAQDTHTLVNSNMGVQLEAVARGLREIARLRGLPGDDEAASVAEAAYQDHERKQDLVDAEIARRAALASGVPPETKPEGTP